MIKTLLSYVNVELKAQYDEVEIVTEKEIADFIEESENNSIEDLKQELFELVHYN